MTYYSVTCCRSQTDVGMNDATVCWMISYVACGINGDFFRENEWNCDNLARCILQCPIVLVSIKMLVIQNMTKLAKIKMGLSTCLP